MKKISANKQIVSPKCIFAARIKNLLKNRLSTFK